MISLILTNILDKLRGIVEAEKLDALAILLTRILDKGTQPFVMEGQGFIFLLKGGKLITKGEKFNMNRRKVTLNTGNFFLKRTKLRLMFWTATTNHGTT
jgi:hypothetical protein